MTGPNGVLHLRVALTTREYASLVEFFGGGLGVEPAESWVHEDGHGSLFDMGGGSLEIFDESYARHIDDIEVGRPVSGSLRLALQVPDVHAAVERLLERGGTLVHPPVLTPWGDLNARIESPDGLQVTLFEVPGDIGSHD